MGAFRCADLGYITPDIYHPCSSPSILQLCELKHQGFFALVWSVWLSPVRRKRHIVLGQPKITKSHPVAVGLGCCVVKALPSEATDIGC
jgi:hypothetical protein